MRRNRNKSESNKHKNSNLIVPNSFRFISYCIKTVSSNVRSAGASVAFSIAGDSSVKDKVLWSCFDRLELSPSSVKHVLLLGYSNGFQVLDIDDGSNFSELVSRRDDPVTFLQMQPIPEASAGHEGFRMSHPLLLVVASEETRGSGSSHNERDGYTSQMGNSVHFPTAVRFYSLRSHNYVHVLRFRSTVYMVRCSPRIVAVGLASQIYCFDALTLENKFSVVTYPAPHLGGQGQHGINIGYGSMAVGPRWLAYASNNPLSSTTVRLSPQSLSPSPGVSPSTSPGNGSLVARYAMESSKQLAAGLINLGDMGYKTLSKYCHELLPDGSSSPVSSNSSRKGGRGAVHSSDADNAGMVVIKDFVSRAVISQFRAHTSPISALCFDPSGTLLVTASIHGNNINVFQILPSSSQNESGNQTFDWNSSHVHLFKLHRGMTSAVIQDICFSQYSQWVAVVSSKGTCHIFVLSPSGSQTGLQLQNSKISGPTLSAWWSTSSCVKNQSLSPPAPAAITLSVVSRIKNNFGWLNTVSTAASSASGKASVPPGVIAATFHSSVRHNLEPAVLSANALEHLMVYSPSGYVIQYELLPSIGAEQGESPPSYGISSMAQMQDEDLRVKAEPIQWWDVSRRADWPEREDCIGGLTYIRPDAAETVMDNSDHEDISLAEEDLTKPQEQSHWHLSNAEVQMRSGRVPVWQKSKIYFYVMAPPLCEEMNISTEYAGGEMDIETIPLHEVEVRQKDVLRIFESSHRKDWTDGRVFAADRYPAALSNSGGSNEKFPEDSTVSDAKPMVSPFRTESYNAGSSRALAEVQFLEEMKTQKSDPISVQKVNGNNGVNLLYPVDQRSFAGVNAVLSSEPPATVICSLDENYIMNSPSPVHGSFLTTARGAQSSASVMTSDGSNAGSSRSNSSMNIVDEGPMHEDMQDMLHFGHDFQEEYCKPSTNEENRKLTEVNDNNSRTSSDDKKKADEDGDLLGGVFDFSEES